MGRLWNSEYVTTDMQQCEYSAEKSVITCLVKLGGFVNENRSYMSLRDSVAKVYAGVDENEKI